MCVKEAKNTFVNIQLGYSGKLLNKSRNLSPKFIQEKYLQSLDFQLQSCKSTFFMKSTKIYFKQILFFAYMKIESVS